MVNKENNISRDDLKKSLEDLTYEIDMLYFSAMTLIKGRIAEPFPQIPTLKNALIESFAIHIRNLIEFLYWNKKNGRDRVLAEYIIGDAELWHSQLGEMTEEINTIYEKACKRVAHLTIDRIYVTPEDKNWWFAKYTKEVALGLKIFLELVPKEMKDVKLKDAISRITNI
jgi:hypothetical protein